MAQRATGGEDWVLECAVSVVERWTQIHDYKQRTDQYKAMPGMCEGAATAEAAEQGGGGGGGGGAGHRYIITSSAQDNRLYEHRHRRRE